MSSCGTTSESGDPPTQCQEAQGRAGQLILAPGRASESSLYCQQSDPEGDLSPAQPPSSPWAFSTLGRGRPAAQPSLQTRTRTGLQQPQRPPAPPGPGNG